LYKAKIYITLKEGILDPQGKAVMSSLISLGYDETEDVRVGKFIEVYLQVEQITEAEERVNEMCKKLLANTVIENYSYQIEEVEK